MKARPWMKLKDEYKICKEVFGQEYKRFDEFDGRIDYTRRDFLDKLLEQKEVIDHMRIELFEANLALKCLCNMSTKIDTDRRPPTDKSIVRAIKTLEEFSNIIDNIFWDTNNVNVIYRRIKIAYKNLIDELKLEEITGQNE